jgi:2-dehydro-3-deoxygluconokinase
MKAAMIEGYKVSTLALPTFGDDQALFGDSTPADCAKRISGYGVKEIVVKTVQSLCCVVDTSSFPLLRAGSGHCRYDGAGDSSTPVICCPHVRPRALDAARLGHCVAGRVIRERRPLCHGRFPISQLNGVDSLPCLVLNSRIVSA